MSNQALPNFNARFGAIITIVMTLIGWSSIPLFLKHFARDIDLWSSNGWRYGFSALLWLPVLIVGLLRSSLPERLWRAALIPSVINGLSQTLFCWAHYKIDPGLLSFGLRSNIVFATIGAAIFFAAERRVIRTPGYLTGILMVVGGTLGTILLGTQPLRGATFLGVMLAVSSGAGFAAYAVSVRYFMDGINAIQSFAAISLFTALPMLPLMYVFGDPSRAGLGEWGGAVVLDLPWGQIGLLLLSAIIGIALGHVFYYYSISKLGVAVSSGVVQLQPFFVAVASFFLFDERLTLPQWASGTVAIGGAAMILFVQHRMTYGASRPIARQIEVIPLDAVAAAAEADPKAGRC